VSDSESKDRSLLGTTKGKSNGCFSTSRGTSARDVKGKIAPFDVSLACACHVVAFITP